MHGTKSQLLENEINESYMEQAPRNKNNIKQIPRSIKSDGIAIDIESVDLVECLPPDDNTQRHPGWMSDYVTDL